MDSSLASYAGWNSHLTSDTDRDEEKNNVTRGPFVQLVKRRDAMVVWETGEATGTVLSYGKDGALTEVWEDSTPKMRHVVKLTGLQPSTTYSFQAKTETWTTEMGQFTTEVGPAEPHRIAVYGDTRTGHADHLAIVHRLAAHKPMLAFHSGDLVGNGDDPRQWDEFLWLEQALLRRTVLYPAMGNHEGDGELFTKVFELPGDTPAPERYYAVRWAASLFVVLDQFGASLHPGGAQYAWLERVLREARPDPAIRNRFVVLHHGPFDSGKHGSNLAVRAALVPLFERYDVDMVFSGHDHDYERSTVRGVKYVVSGGAGAPHHRVRGDWWTEVGETVTHYCLLDIQGARVGFKALRLDGSELDSFSLRSAPGECVEPVDCAPRERGVCEAGQGGWWACVLGGCVWDCAQDVDSKG